MADEFESVHLVCREVYVYKLPPRQSNRGYRAADWGLEKPMWTCRLRITSKGNKCFVTLQDQNTGDLFAQCPVDAYPGRAVEPVSDSSRYFVLRVDDGSGKHAFLGMGFQERGDAFDFNVALQDHFKRETKVSSEKAAEPEAYVPKVDLTLKQGQTFRLNIKKKETSGDDEPEVKKSSAPMVSLTSASGAFVGGGGGGLLPPPGGLYKPGSAAANAQPAAASAATMFDPFGASSAPAAPAAKPAAAKAGSNPFDDWSDFDSLSISKPAAPAAGAAKKTDDLGDWVKF